MLLIAPLQKQLFLTVESDKGQESSTIMCFFSVLRCYSVGGGAQIFSSKIRYTLSNCYTDTQIHRTIIIVSNRTLGHSLLHTYMQICVVIIN